MVQSQVGGARHGPELGGMVLSQVGGTKGPGPESGGRD